MKEFVTVFTASKARQLLKEGFTIVDIKADKTDEDHKRSIFVFRNEKDLLEKIKSEHWKLHIEFSQQAAQNKHSSYDFHFWTSKDTYNK